MDGCMDGWAAAQREREREKCYVIKITKQFLAEGLFPAWATLAVMTLSHTHMHTHTQRMPKISAARTLGAFVYMEVLMCGILNTHISQTARERALMGGGRDYVNVAHGEERVV